MDQTVIGRVRDEHLQVLQLLLRVEEVVELLDDHLQVFLGSDQPLQLVFGEGAGVPVDEVLGSEAELLHFEEVVLGGFDIRRDTFEVAHLWRLRGRPLARAAKVGGSYLVEEEEVQLPGLLALPLLQVLDLDRDQVQVEVFGAGVVEFRQDLVH